MVANKEKLGGDILIAVILTDKDRRIQWVNSDFTRITGYSISEVYGKKPSILQGVNTEPEVVESIKHALNNELPIKTEITNYRKDGEEYLCKLVIYPVFDEKEELTNFIAFEIDGDAIKDDSEISLLQLRPKYFSSSLTDAKALDIFVKLNALFEQEKSFLDPDLKLKDLADKLNTNTRYLSQVVNKETGHNILHFINSFRIEEAKKKIGQQEYAHLTTFGVAQLCGFKNKSTFYKVFKEFMGVTPKIFIKENNGSSSSEIQDLAE